MDDVAQCLTCSACIGDYWLVQLDLAGHVFYSIKDMEPPHIESREYPWGQVLVAPLDLIV